MTENTKPERSFCVVAVDNEEIITLYAKSPRDAAVKAFNSPVFVNESDVEVFEFGRGKRYVRQSTAVPAGKVG
jgi:hypothetical protein